MIRTIIVAALTAAVALMHVSAGARDARLCGWVARVGEANLESAGCANQCSGVVDRRGARCAIVAGARWIGYDTGAINLGRQRPAAHLREDFHLYADQERHTVG